MNSKNLLFILFSSCLFSQSFNYDRAWATYYGATNSRISGIYEENSMDLKIEAITALPSPNISTPTSSYYNQFITTGGQTYISGTYPHNNNFPGKISSSGNLLSAEYTIATTPYASIKSPYTRDLFGNSYEIENTLINFPTLSSGAWLSNNITNTDIILAKYDSYGNLLWKTYIPNTNTYVILKTDDNGNIYITGNTKWQYLGDPGTFQPDFEIVPNGAGILANSFIVKLNPQGNKIWATYTPASYIGGIDIYNNNIYIISDKDLKNTNSSLATAGTYQFTKSGQAITKLNADTGERIWGTYYGQPSNLSGAVLSDIKVNQTGIYVLGNTYSGPGNYYATAGAYKAQTTDGSDLFLTKFNETGNRDWSTYIGSDGNDIIAGNKNLDIKDDKVLLVGNSAGSNIASAGAFVSTKPNPNSIDFFFTMFNSSGSHIFTSYYGGTFPSISQAQTINCEFSKSSDTFYLFGGTERTNGYSSSNGYQQNIIFPSGITKGTSGFLAKFSSKFLSTSEVNSSEDLVLYDNPNNGNFCLKGSVLDKEEHIIEINDMSGRLIYSKNIQKNKEEHFNLENQLKTGNYILSVKKKDKTPVKTFKLIIKK